ncbi:RNA-binding domain-containing protein [Myriangium duriaei CBS 260.36]|uniref:RNA-binding domain-containing protein n=1 Tax=Myriangium duriaei CBS 260.36 TaxID=1168546 RepID=A0A9P4JA10_9PEZI|nr:RNA-binding domain-containing protein [Myriangium duriaei CBS 260.36]
MPPRSPSYARSVSRGRSYTRSPIPRSRTPSRSRSRTPRTRRHSRSRSRSPRRSPSPRRYRARSYSRSRSFSRSRSRSRSISPLPRSSKIVIEKLTKNINLAHLREIFSVYGEIADLDMPMNRQFQTNRGTAYILYASPASAERAIAHMHEGQLDGAKLSVSIVLPRRRFERSPPPRRPPPDRFGEPHRYRDGDMEGGTGATVRGRGGESESD